MSEIIKTEAVVLNKMNYGDTSKIAVFYTKELGKFSAIIKGARSSKSKIGMQIDIFNHVQIVLYKKATRELQIVTQADLISHFPDIKNNLSNLKYATAVLELVQSLTLEGETNELLFKGIVRILTLFNSSDEEPGILLCRFILFFIKELGYELQFEHCSKCGTEITLEKNIFFNFDKGMICNNCKINVLESYHLSQELFNFFLCLTRKKKIVNNKSQVDSAINFLEKFLKFHIHEFKGIKSIHLY